MFAYIRTLADDVCQTLVVGYTTFTKSAAESTQDFKAGFATGDRTTDTLDSQIIAAKSLIKGKKTIPGTPADDARKAAHAKLKELNVLAAASRKGSTAFKVGRWMRNPLINTWKFVKSLWNGTSTTQKIVSAVAVCAFGAFVAAAINVLGFSLLATTTLTAAASIGFSRAVFIKHKISWYVECLVDVTIFVAYTMYILS